MPNQLSNVTTTKIAIVDRGANRKRFYLTKREGTNMSKELIESLLNHELNDDAKEILKSLDGDTKDSVEAVVKVLAATKDLPDDVLVRIGKAVGITTPALSESEINILVEKKMKTDKKKADAIKKAENGVVDISKVDTSPEVKALLGVMQAKIEKSDIDNIERDKKQKETETKLEKAEQVALRKAAVEKAANFPLVGSKEELADLLLATQGEEAKKLENVLKAANERIKKGDLFAEIGSNLDGGSGDKLETKAVEIQKRDNCSIQSARVTAMDENPELFQ